MSEQKTNRDQLSLLHCVSNKLSKLEIFYRLRSLREWHKMMIADNIVASLVGIRDHYGKAGGGEGEVPNTNVCAVVRSSDKDSWGN